MPSYLAPSGLQPFQQDLMGVWTNDGVPRADNGGPLSYNIMPLPQISPSNTGAVAFHGYILKNFAYTETSSFGRETAQAPNRGGQGITNIDTSERNGGVIASTSSTSKPAAGTARLSILREILTIACTFAVQARRPNKSFLITDLLIKFFKIPVAQRIPVCGFSFAPGCCCFCIRVSSTDCAHMHKRLCYGLNVARHTMRLSSGRPRNQRSTGIATSRT